LPSRLVTSSNAFEPLSFSYFAKSILRYISGTQGSGDHYPKGSSCNYPLLLSISDAEFASDEDRKSNYGSTFNLTTFVMWPTPVFTDSQSTQHIINNRRSGRSKHWDARLRKLCEYVDSGQIVYLHIPTKFNLSDYSCNPGEMSTAIFEELTQVLTNSQESRKCETISRGCVEIFA
jgi:hypothetical protein